MTLTICAESASGEDLAGCTVSISIDGDEPVREQLRDRLDSEPFNESAPLVVTLPTTTGQHTCTLTIETSAGREKYSRSLDFECRPVGVSIALWDVPTPIVSGQPFDLKVGVKSACGANLSGSTIEIVDETGSALANGQLGDAPLENTDALYWTEISLPAPSAGQRTAWVIRFEPAESELPHTTAELPFAFAAAPPPAHSVTVAITDECGQPIAGARIRLGAFRAATDATGTASLQVPGGEHDIAVWHPAFEVQPARFIIERDIAIQLRGKLVEHHEPAVAYWS